MADRVVRHTPLRLLIITAVSLFVAEAFIMFFFLPNMPPLSPPIEAVFDSLILTVLVFPILYLFLFRPMILHITERRRAEETTKLAYSELDQVFQTAADGMRVIDKDFNTLRINETFATLTGINKDEATGKKCYEVFPGPQCHTSSCSLKRVFSSNERIEFESIKERKDGIKVPCIVTATPFRGSGGELIGIVEDFKDITERKKSEEALRKSEEELKRRVKELEEFYDMAVGRELRMIELKKEIESLKEELSKYKKVESRQ